MDVTINTSDEDCIVTGALSLLLRLSSFLGVAPLRFAPVRNGYKISASHYHAWYGYILVTILNAIGCVTILADFKIHISEINWEYICHIVTLIIIIIVCSQGTYCGGRRMKNMITFLKCINEIKRNMKVEVKHKTIQNKLTILIIMAHLFIILAFVVCQVITNFQQNTFKDAIRLGYLVLYIHLTLLFLLQAQVVLMFMELKSFLHMINNTIDEMLSLDVFENPPSSTFSNKIRYMTSAYLTACNLVSELNSANGIIVVLIMCYLIARMLNIGCHLASASSIQYNLLILIIWCVLNCVDFLAFIEAFNCIDKEVTNIKVRLCKLMFRATDIRCRIPIELKLMYRQLNLNKITFTPLSLFTLERTLTIKILSGILTYFLFIVQISK